MDRPQLDQLARSLVQIGSRRTVLKAAAAGVVSGGLLIGRTRSSAAEGRSNQFAQCMEGCLRICEQQHNCRITERDCAANCSNAEL